MFGFFKKKEPFKVVAPAKGKLINLEKVSDPVFAQKMMGDGFAIKPKEANGEISIVAPVSGKIVSLPNTKHAFGIHTDDGIDVLVHIGVDTVNLKGKGFTSFSEQGKKVKRGEKIIQVDSKILQENKIDDTIMTIFTDGYDKEILLTKPYGNEVSENEELIG